MWLMIALAIAYGACLVAYLVASLKVARILGRAPKLDMPDVSGAAPLYYGTTRRT